MLKFPQQTPIENALCHQIWIYIRPMSRSKKIGHYTTAALLSNTWTAGKISYNCNTRSVRANATICLETGLSAASNKFIGATSDWDGLLIVAVLPTIMEWLYKPSKILSLSIFLLRFLPDLHRAWIGPNSLVFASNINWLNTLSVSLAW